MQSTITAAMAACDAGEGGGALACSCQGMGDGWVSVVELADALRRGRIGGARMGRRGEGVHG